MKENFFKYLFTLVIIVLIVFTIYYFNKEKKSTTQKTSEHIQEQVQETSEDLIIGISNYDTINPIITKNKEIQKINKLIFQPLVEIDENYKTKMCLATEISKTGDNVYLVKLDTNSKWQDGSTVCAKDVQFTIDRLKEIDSIYSYNVKNIVQVEIVDSSMVKIFLDTEVPFFEYNLTFPILSNYYYLNEDFFASTKIPIGTGMYKITEIQSSYIQLQKNEYWKGQEETKINNIRINIFAQMGEVYNSFKIQNIDLINTSNVNVEEYIGTIGFNKLEYKGREFDYLSFNCQDEVLKNKEIRQAIGYAIDKSNIVSEVYENKYYISHFPLDYGSYLYQDNFEENNLEKIPSVLEKEGWSLENNIWRKKVNNKWVTASFKLTVNKEDVYRTKVAEVIKKQLEKVGMKVSIIKVSQENYNQSILNKNYEMILTGVYNSYSPNLQNFFADGNISNYSEEKMNKLLDEVKNITNEDMLKEKYKKIFEIYNEDMPFVSLYRNKNSVIYTSALAGEVTANNYNCFYNINKWIKKVF